MGGHLPPGIDVLVIRGLVYALLAATVLVALGAVPTAGGTLPTAVATLLALALARPLSAQAERAAGRRFRRRRYEAVCRVERFLVEVREGHAPPERVEAVLADVLGDPALKVCYRLPESDVHVDGGGHLVDPRPDQDQVAAPFARGEAAIGVVLHGRSAAERPDILRAVMAAAGLAFEVARLRAELKRQLVEVEASRALLARATENERRRVERDLHDGAQQRLVALGISLRRTQRRLDGGDPAALMLDEAVAELTAAVDGLRALAHGEPVEARLRAVPAAGGRR